MSVSSNIAILAEDSNSNDVENRILFMSCTPLRHSRDVISQIKSNTKLVLNELDRREYEYTNVN